MQASFAQEVPLGEQSGYAHIMHALGSVIGLLGSIPCCILCPNPYKEVHQGSVGLVERYGKYYKTVDPGLVNVNPISESIHRVDVKMQITSIQDISIMTKDNVYITIDCVVYWHIVDVYRATYGVAELEKALLERAQTSLRAILGGRSLQDCIENRESIGQSLGAMLEEPAASWGIRVENTLIKDLQFSRELQQSLSSAATQKRVGESKVIAAKAEVDAAKLMREASEILNTPAAMQIRYLDTMAQMSKSGQTKVIFMPVPGPDPQAGMDGSAVATASGRAAATPFTPQMAALTEYMGEQRE
ncbi:band 7 family-domain-containing protein [Syncephalis pseudoplumigaleata]|uniref:Band 7 family-domain-containing protein n=1 Tax=Syncephalis pseudoplumigaleata TaxID=1712513 RepID=A0A4P9Z583_9FUNG|nr:band 7 family-domain-containing protein [Syncephalis pseudoplumigaleata]|eukprot:RKP27763.1 band 7 family-domain-containing protein [Syncephalis pseudoplumigaleata]